MKRKISFLLIFVVYFAVLTSCGYSSFVRNYSKHLNNYNINLTLDDETKNVTANQVVQYRNKTGVALDNVCFHLYPRAFSQGVVNKPVNSLNESSAYPNEKSYCTFTIDSVLVNDKEVEYSEENVDKDILCVPISNKLYNNGVVLITINYSFNIPNINHRFGYGNNATNLANFYPIACVWEDGDFVKDSYNSSGDPFCSDLANYRVTITYDEELTLASTGEQIKTQITDGNKQTYMQAYAVRDFAMVLSNKFNVKTSSVGDTTIFYYYHSDEQSDKSLQTCIDSLQTFNNLIGTYPYKTLSIVESNFINGGMEYPNLVIISDNLSAYSDYTNTIIHEIAHQWWYGVVGNNEFEFGWLDEGITEYCTALFYRENPEYEINYDDIVKNAMNSYLLFMEVYTDVFGEVETNMNRALDEYRTEPEYVYMAYVKGILMYDNVCNLIGYKNFKNAIKLYYNANKGTNANPTDLINAFVRVSNQGIGDILTSYIEGNEVIQSLN